VKKALAALAAFVLMTAAAPAGATGFTIFGSWWNPDAVGEALGGGISLSFPLGDSGLGMDFRGSFYQETGDESPIVHGPDSVFREFGLQIVPVDAALRYDFNQDGAANLYLGGGASYFFLDVDQGPDLDDELGWLAFVGAEFGDPAGARFFLEGSYRSVTSTIRSDGDEIVDDVPIDLDGAMVNLGIVWRF
jgi:hypothetical protein